MKFGIFKVMFATSRPYCKYHFPTYKSFDSKEEELMHFLERMGDSDWEWKEQYETKGFDEGKQPLTLMFLIK